MEGRCGAEWEGGIGIGLALADAGHVEGLFAHFTAVAKGFSLLFLKRVGEGVSFGFGEVGATNYLHI